MSIETTHLNLFKIVKGNANRTSYRVYRSTSVDGKYLLLGETTDTVYFDATAVEDTTYYYKVMAVKKEISQSEVTAFSKPVISGTKVTAVITTGQSEVYISWRQTTGADGYYLFRKPYGGSYQLIGTVSGGATYSYDRTAVVQNVYSYSAVAYKHSSYGLVNSAIAGEMSGGMCPTTVINQVKLTSNEKMNLQLQVDWSAVTGAARYNIWRSLDPNYNYSLIAVANGGTQSYTDSTIQLGQRYYYKIVVEQDVAGVTLKSWPSLGNFCSVTGNPIMGATTVTAAQMAAHYRARSTVPYPAAVYGNPSKGAVDTVEKFAQIVIEEGNKEGVRAEVIWAQICNETGFLRFDGDVKAEQCNFAGIGATGGGVTGNTFATVRLGIQAQVQHLKAYASREPLNYPCVDPRFDYVMREAAPYVEWLGIQENPYHRGWAAAPNYGYYLMILVGQVKSY